MEFTNSENSELGKGTWFVYNEKTREVEEYKGEIGCIPSDGGSLSDGWKIVE